MRKVVATGNVPYFNPSSNVDILKQINDVLKGIASDISQIVYEYNNEVYPVLSSLPQGTTDTRWTLTSDNCPRVEGLDGRGLFVDNESTLASDGGKYWYSLYARPKTLKEVLADLDARITSISNSTGSTSDVLLRSAGDFNTFTLKTTPVASDLILIEDSASSYVKKKVLVSSIGGGGSDIEVQDDDVTVETELTTLNFIGDGVTATTGGAGIVDITIPTWTSGLTVIESHGTVASASIEVPIVTPAAGYFWTVQKLTLTSISVTPVAASLLYDGAVIYAFDIPAEETLEYVWSGEGTIIADGYALTIIVDTPNVINYKADGYTGLES